MWPKFRAWYFLIYWSWYLDQKTVKWPFFGLRVNLPATYLTNQTWKHLIKCLAQGCTCELLAYFPHYPFNAERQAEKL